ncbi:MAG: DUF4249 family protein [Bacteroidota bacterium]
MKPLFALALLVVVYGCTDPVVPAFDDPESFYLVEGSIADRTGVSQAKVSRYERVNDRFLLLPQREMTVSSVAEDGTEVTWFHDTLAPGTYFPPPDFTAVIGRAYFLRVLTPQGDLFESRPEVIPFPVPITELAVSFDQESYFRPSLQRFVPAFSYSLSFQDPVGTPNYYQASYRYWETTRICASCDFGRWRDGTCIPDSRNTGTWDYECGEICYAIRYGDELNIISDEFGDGALIADLPVGRLDHNRNTGGLLFEAQLNSISKEAHTYLRVLTEISEDGGGLNATIPTALLGNVSAIVRDGISPPLVLGFVNAVSTSAERLYLDRTEVDGRPLPSRISPVWEPPLVNCPPPIGCPPTPPCSPNIFRTPVQPEGWGE